MVKLSVGDLIAYRQAREQLVQRIGRRKIQTTIGEVDLIGYRTPFDKVTHFALAYCDIERQGPVTVRLHGSNILNDVFGGGGDVATALEHIRAAGAGVLIYLRDDAAGVPELSGNGKLSSDAHRVQNWLDIGLGSQILRDLGVLSIRLIASRERNYVGMRGFDIDVVRQVSLN